MEVDGIEFTTVGGLQSEIRSLQSENKKLKDFLKEGLFRLDNEIDLTDWYEQIEPLTQGDTNGQI